MRQRDPNRLFWASSAERGGAPFFRARGGMLVLELTATERQGPNAPAKGGLEQPQCLRGQLRTGSLTGRWKLHHDVRACRPAPTASEHSCATSLLAAGSVLLWGEMQVVHVTQTPPLLSAGTPGALVGIRYYFRALHLATASARHPVRAAPPPQHLGWGSNSSTLQQQEH